MFTNKPINGYTYATRFIASWVREGGKLRTKEDIDNLIDVLYRIDNGSLIHEK